MKHKTYIIAFFSFLFLLFFPNKTNAVNVSYCQYSDDLSLILPVTIEVHATIIDLHDPFSAEKTKRETYTYYIYDEKSCTKTIGVPYPGKDFLPTYNFYYRYPDKLVAIPAVSKGVYQIKDITPPVITPIANYFTTNVHDKIDLSLFSNLITAYDDTDGSIPVEITYDNYSDNYDKLGEYTIVFKACDKSSNCSNFQLKMYVVDAKPPTIEGPEKIISYMSDPLTISEIGSKLSAYDNYDGDVSYNIYLVETNYNTQIPDTYYARFEVKDYSNNKIKQPFTIHIEVKDDIAPTIEGPSEFTIHLSNYLDTKTILSNLIVTDNIDKYVLNNLYLIDDTYSKSNKKTGRYTLVAGAYDSSGNESSPYHISIEVIDDILPIIDGERMYESYMSSPLTLEQIKSSLIATDNYDGNIINKLEVISDTYSNCKENIGVYNVLFIVKDSSNNESAPFSVEIIVYDDISPYIEGVNFYNILVSEKIDILSIKISLHATDNVDGDITSSIVLDSDTYSENYATPGTYFATFYVVDNSGNLSNLFKVKIVVSEDLSFLRSINNSYIHLDTSTLVEVDQILNILGVDSSKYLSINTIENTYSDNYNVEGEYLLKLEFQHQDYTKENIDIKIKTFPVSPAIVTENTPSVESKKKETIFTKIISFIKNLFANIVLFFKKLF